HKFSAAGRIRPHISSHSSVAISLLSAIWNKWFVAHLMYIIWI
ncbi:unnamed protein product, partial [Musa textilis]